MVAYRWTFRKKKRTIIAVEWDIQSQNICLEVSHKNSLHKEKSKQTQPLPEVLANFSHIDLFVVNGENLFQLEPFWKTVMQTLFSLKVTELIFCFLQQSEWSFIKYFTINGTTLNWIRLKRSTVLLEIENSFLDFYYRLFQTPQYIKVTILTVCWQVENGKRHPKRAENQGHLLEVKAMHDDSCAYLSAVMQTLLPHLRTHRLGHGWPQPLESSFSIPPASVLLPIPSEACWPWSTCNGTPSYLLGVNCHEAPLMYTQAGTNRQRSHAGAGFRWGWWN